MGRAVLRLAPELLVDFVPMLPRSVRVVGSAPGDGSVALWVESDLIDSERGDLMATVRIDGLSQTIVLEQASG